MVVQREMKICFLLNENLNEDLCIEFTSEKLHSISQYKFILITTDHGYRALNHSQRSCFYNIFSVANFRLSTLIEFLQPHIKLIDLELTRIVGYDEEVLSLAAELREHFNIPGDRPKDIYHFTNKMEMKKKLKDSSIHLPRHLLYDGEAFNHSPKQYLNYIISKLGFPIFAKPIDKTASVDTQLICTIEKLHEWCVEHQFDKNFELDEYITGEFYSCNTIILNKKIQHAEVTQYLNPSYDYLCGKPRGSITLPAELSIVREILKYNHEILKLLLPPDNCITHLEVFKKITGELIFIEIAARPPGSGISKLYEKRIGINLQQIFMLMQMKLNPALSIKLGAYTAVAFFPPQKGIVSKIFPLEFKSKNTISWKIKVGDHLSYPKSIIEEAGQLFMSNTNYSELKEDFLSIHTMTPFDVALSNDAYT